MSPQAAGAPLGPQSLLWRYAGDWRSMLPGSSTGLLQLLHPAIGAGVAQHSAFFEDPFARIRRSIPQIWATIFDGDESGRGRAVRDLHRAIKGDDDAGRRYHALEPETFWWAHATFTWNIFRSVELFHLQELSPEAEDQLYAETVTWYRRYGVSERPVPPDYRAFRAKFEYVCAEVLEMNPAAAAAMGYRLADVPGRTFGPSLVRGIVEPVMAPAAEILVRGCLPRTVRRRFGVRWTPADAAQLRGLAAAVRQGFRFVPHALNRRTFIDVHRWIGSRTRDQRFRPVA
ncbi:MAG TPA: oxygenase MpaB family protein [Acidimicrobiales bacterium]|nr:oxygenase MpaB family protein [Acidimicrobiales bacterium]